MLVQGTCWHTVHHRAREVSGALGATGAGGGAPASSSCRGRLPRMRRRSMLRAGEAGCLDPQTSKGST
eukprot:3952529-Alexandrium_andersonii.AAC.1